MSSKSGRPLGRKNNRLCYQQYNDMFLEDVDECREKLGMKPLDIKKRPCMRCSKTFTSFGKQHRMCDSCREYASKSECSFDNEVSID